MLLKIGVDGEKLRGVSDSKFEVEVAFVTHRKGSEALGGTRRRSGGAWVERSTVR